MLRRCLYRPQNLQNALQTPACRQQLRQASNDAKQTPTSPKRPLPRLWLHILSVVLSPRFILLTTKVCAASLLAFHLLSTHFYILEGAFGISMLPTIAMKGDVLLISKYHRRGRELKVGDLISYRLPYKTGEFGSKRVLGLAGDFVMLDTPGVDGEGRMIQVPPGHCWIVGDNVTWSRDSRLFGALPLGLVTGKVVGKFRWPKPWTWESLEHGLQSAYADEEDVD